MPTIKVKKGPEIPCNKGDNLLKVLLSAGLILENPCNGKGTCGKCRVRILSGDFSPVSVTELRHLKAEELAAGIRLSCLTEILGDGEVELPRKEGRLEVLTGGVLPDFQRDELEGYGVAVDIGTTTLALNLVDRKNGRELANASAINPQKQFGLDVLTRISYELEQGDEGIKQLQSVIIVTINNLLEGLCREASLPKSEIREIVVAANCAMTHMLLGVDARSLGKAPYQPVFTEGKELLASDIGLQAAPHTKLYCLPQVSAYIGGDIVAGVCACQLAERKERTLFIDIGTNGEIVLAHEGELLSCSCAAGPALEGMNISCGVRAAEGAVEDVSITKEGIILKTIGGKAPTGLCGSGILAAVRELVKGGFVKKSGAFVSLDQAPQEGILRLDGSKREAVLSADPEIIVTKNDLRQVQLAKGAILSGFRVLLREAGIAMEELDSVIIAGQFGSHLPVESLVGIGLLPQAVEQKLRYVGNSSKTGAMMALLSQSKRQEMEQLARQIQYIELAETRDYERVFATAMVLERQ